MRILFTVSAWAGHWYPLVPLGWALQASGHEVRVACAPSQCAGLHGAGLTPVPVLDEVDIAFLGRLHGFRQALDGSWPHETLPPHPATGLPMTSLSDFAFAEMGRETGRRFAAPARRSHEAAVEFARTWRPALVVHEPLSTEGLLAARVLGVPAVCHLWGPVGIAEDDPGLGTRPQDHTGEFRRHGAGELGPDLVEHVVDPCPAALRPQVGSAARLPVRYIPYNGPGAATALPPGPAGRPRVCVVWGNSPRRMVGQGAFALPRVLAALDGLGAEVVLAAGPEDIAELGPVPDTVRVLERRPLAGLLPGCCAVVHHGGAGVVMTSLAAGVPQLVLPHAMDQFLNARRVAGSGAGICLPGRLAGREALQEAVTSLLDDDAYRDAAHELARECAAMPSPLRLAADLTRLALAAG